VVALLRRGAQENEKRGFTSLIRGGRGLPSTTSPARFSKIIGTRLRKGGTK